MGKASAPSPTLLENPSTASSMNSSRTAPSLTDQAQNPITQKRTFPAEPSGLERRAPSPLSHKGDPSSEEEGTEVKLAGEDESKGSRFARRRKTTAAMETD